MTTIAAPIANINLDPVDESTSLRPMMPTEYYADTAYNSKTQELISNQTIDAKEQHGFGGLVDLTPLLRQSYPNLVGEDLLALNDKRDIERFIEKRGDPKTIASDKTLDDPKLFAKTQRDPSAANTYFLQGSSGGKWWIFSFFATITTLSWIFAFGGGLTWIRHSRDLIG